jgi:hypothetical protein
VIGGSTRPARLTMIETPVPQRVQQAQADAKAASKGTGAGPAEGKGDAAALLLYLILPRRLLAASENWQCLLLSPHERWHLKTFGGVPGKRLAKPAALLWLVSSRPELPLEVRPLLRQPWPVPRRTRGSAPPRRAGSS